MAEKISRINKLIQNTKDAKLKERLIKARNNLLNISNRPKPVKPVSKPTPKPSSKTELAEKISRINKLIQNTKDAKLKERLTKVRNNLLKFDN